MIETEEIKKKRKQRESEKEMEEKLKFDEENEQMIEITQQTINERKDEIKQLEHWTNTTFDNVIFDTECCDWNENTSTFNKHIEGYDNNVFIVEDENGNVFGGFISTKIELFALVFGEYHYYKYILDPEAFVFSLQSNGRLPKPMKFDIKLNGIANAFRPQTY